MKSLYLECNSGISGDMAVAALLDAGADKDVLMQVLNSIPAEGFKIEITRVKKNGIDCCDFNVVLEREHDNHDHDMEYLFGYEHHHDEYAHHDDHAHHHEEHAHHDEHHHDEHAHHHEHHHEHRTLSDVLSIIKNTKMTESAKNLASRIFNIIASSESKAHGIPLEQVHFHEVGALDSIVDVIAFAVCFDNLSIKRVFVPSLTEGCGSVRCQHGILPIPVPAVLNIVSDFKIPLCVTNVHGEFVTPTGAAFVAAVMTDVKLPKNFFVKSIGMGAGKRTYEKPSILRAMIIEHDEDFSEERVVQLETNIDDSTGEALGFVQEELFLSGAKDVSFIPCFMKKNRPAYLVCVLCSEKDVSKIEEVLFLHTTTIGVRKFFVDRTTLCRRQILVNTEWGEAKVKCVKVNGKDRFYPEYESVAFIARSASCAFSDAYNKIVSLCASHANS